jgi:hypothetical protein
VRRARWLALGLILGLASIAVAQTFGIAFAQGGPGLFFSPSCASLSNPATGSTVCWQTSAPNSFFFWDGTAFSSPTLGGPYAPASFTSGAVLIGGGTGSITATVTPTVQGLTTNGQAALTLGVYGISTGNTGEIRLSELAANGTDYVGFKAPDSIATTRIWTLPNADGANGTCLATNGAGVLSWGTCSAGSGTGITSLNGLNAAVQTVTNDTNVTLVSSVSTHTLTWAGTLAVARGGLGVGTLAANGVLYGNGTSAVNVTPAGAADEVLRVPTLGGAPAFGAVDVSRAAAITGLVRTANLGTGTASAAVFLRGDQTWAGAAGTPTYNFVYNADMERWGAGTTTLPTGWTTSGGSVTFAKNTTAGQFKTGTASLAITRAAGNVGASQDINVAYPPIGAWQSQIVTCGGWVYATTATTTKVIIDDGVGGNSGSSFHSGGSTLEFLTVTRSISNIATRVQVQLLVSGTNTTSSFDSIICVLGSAIANWQPSGYIGRTRTFALSTGNTALLAGTTNYMAAGYASTTETAAEIAMPFRGVCRNWSYRSAVAPGGAGDTIALRPRVNEALLASVASASIASTAQQISNLTDEGEIAQGARVTMRAVLSVAAASSQVSALFDCEEVPAGI